MIWVIRHKRCQRQGNKQELDTPDKKNPAGAPLPVKPQPHAQKPNAHRHKPPKSDEPKSGKEELFKVDDGENHREFSREVCQLVSDGRAHVIWDGRDRHRCCCCGCHKSQSGALLFLKGLGDTGVGLWGREVRCQGKCRDNRQHYKHHRHDYARPPAQLKEAVSRLLGHHVLWLRHLELLDGGDYPLQLILVAVAIHAPSYPGGLSRTCVLIPYPTALLCPC